MTQMEMHVLHAAFLWERSNVIVAKGNIFIIFLFFLYILQLICCRNQQNYKNRSLKLKLKFLVLAKSVWIRDWMLRDFKLKQWVECKSMRINSVWLCVDSTQISFAAWKLPIKTILHNQIIISQALIKREQ